MSLDERLKRARQQIKKPPAFEQLLFKKERFRVEHETAGRLSIAAQLETHSWGEPVRLVVFVNGILDYTCRLPEVGFANQILDYLVTGNAEGLLDRVNAPPLVTLARYIREAAEAQALRASQVEMEFA